MRFEPTLTPTLSRGREREKSSAPVVENELAGTLSRARERVGVREER